MLHTMESAYGDLLGKTVLDLGCGCSVLSIGAALMGSSFVLGVDLDSDALAIASANVDQFESMSDTIHFLQSDAKQLPSVLRDQMRFDTVIMVRLCTYLPVYNCLVVILFIQLCRTLHSVRSIIKDWMPCLSKSALSV